jgi:hypothetical protein
LGGFIRQLPISGEDHVRHRAFFLIYADLCCIEEKKKIENVLSSLTLIHFSVKFLNPK